MESTMVMSETNVTTTITSMNEDALNTDTAITDTTDANIDTTSEDIDTDTNTDTDIDTTSEDIDTDINTDTDIDTDTSVSSTGSIDSTNREELVNSLSNDKFISSLRQVVHNQENPEILKGSLEEECTDTGVVSSSFTLENQDNQVNQENQKLDLSLADVNKINLEKILGDFDIIQLLNVAKRVKRDPSYNPIPDIPKSIYEFIEIAARNMGMSRKQTNILARNMVVSFGEEIMLNKEIDKLIKDYKEAAVMPDMMSLYNESLQETYEIKIKEEAEKEENPKRKEELLKISQAFTDSYTFEPLLKVLEDAVFISRAPKMLVKHVNRMCDYYDSLLKKTLIHPVSVKTTPRDLYELYPGEEHWRIEMLVLTALYYTRNAQKDDIYFMMFMYSFVFNIHALVLSFKESKKITEFNQKKIEYIEKFFAKLKEVYPQPPEYIKKAIFKIMNKKRKR